MILNTASTFVCQALAYQTENAQKRRRFLITSLGIASTIIDSRGERELVALS